MTSLFLPLFQFSAPSRVTVVGNLNAAEGDDINLKCQQHSRYPVSKGSFFFFQGSTAYVEKVRK